MAISQAPSYLYGTQFKPLCHEGEDQHLTLKFDITEDLSAGDQIGLLRAVPTDVLIEQVAASAGFEISAASADAVREQFASDPTGSVSDLWAIAAAATPALAVADTTMAAQRAQTEDYDVYLEAAGAVTAGAYTADFKIFRDTRKENTTNPDIADGANDGVQSVVGNSE